MTEPTGVPLDVAIRRNLYENVWWDNREDDTKAHDEALSAVDNAAARRTLDELTEWYFEFRGVPTVEQFASKVREMRGDHRERS